MIEETWDYSLEYEDIIYFVVANAGLDQDCDVVMACYDLTEVPLNFQSFRLGYLKEQYGNDIHFNNKLIIWK